MPCFRRSALNLFNEDVAGLKGTKPELGTIGLRCDIDALPVPEEKPDSHADKSKIPGKSHACGHDGHITINLGAAMILSNFRPERTVRFIFQPAEETIPCGAPEMIRATRPYSVTPMLLESPAVAHSATPSEGRLVVKTRYHEPEVNELLKRKIREIVKARCELFGATYEIAEEQGLEPTYNLESMGPLARENAAALGLPLEHIFASMGGDDFGFYGWKVPAYYLTFGIRTSPDFPIAHTAAFDFDEAILPPASAMFASCALRKE